MFSLTAGLLAVLSLASNVACAPTEGPLALEARQNGGFNQQYWANEYAELNYTNGAGGKFALNWDNNPGGNFVVGKGYKPGGPMLFNYTATFRTNGWAYLALYGWTTNPLVEYYVIEQMGQHNPSDNASATQYGTLQSDGGTYEIWQKVRTNAPSIIGTATFQQYWSIRTKMHSGGTINTGNHFNAWKAAGLKLGTQNYLAMVVEGQQGGGSANVTVGVAPTTKVPETPTSTYRSIRRTSTRRTTTTTSTPKTTTSTRAPSTTTSAAAVVTSASSTPVVTSKVDSATTAAPEATAA